MRALDLFCCAGGASAGLVAAGFEVVGVDINPQPEYPYTFVQANALTYPIEGFDLVWASPPCQWATAYKRRPDHVAEVQNLIPQTREHLQAAGVPYIIENVEGARGALRAPVTLCGSMFGLDVRRHRLFETSFPVAPLPCNHKAQTPRFAQATNRKNKRCTVEVGVWRIPLDVQRKAMGIDWMSLEKLSQAIPPSYAQYLAGEFLAARAAEADIRLAR